MWLRIGVLSLIGAVFVATSGTRGAQMLEAFAAGLLCGAALGWLGLRHTRFEVSAEGRFYTPHTYIGLAVLLLFLGRLAYRFLYFSMGTGGAFAADPSAAAAYQRTPLTLGTFGLLVGYYVLYYAGVLFRTRAAAAPAPSAAPSPE
ncbi:MAG: DUF1453 domain-containing protein [Gammaproteobacteria bacterium]|nr:DUF1453 domain-containing protein [Gammaproteobacteria bacterium]